MTHAYTAIMTEQKLLTVKEVAEQLRVSSRTIMRYIYSRKLRATKMGQWRITPEDIAKFLKDNSNK